MRNLLFPFLYAIVLTSVRYALGSSALDYSPNEHDTYTNITLEHGHDPDPRFRLQSHYTTERLPATAALMNTVNLLSEAADINFNDLVVFDKAFTTEDYPSVVIALKTTKAKTLLPACLWVWALYLAASDMIINANFFVSQHDVMWKGRIVARLLYEKAIPNGRTEDDSSIEIFSPLATATSYMEGDTPTFDIKVPLQSTPKNDSSEPGAGKSMSTIAEPGELTLHLQYFKNAKHLPIWTLFMMVLATLKDNAEYAASARVRPFVVTVPGFNANFEITLNGGSPRKRPPFFENAHLNNGVRLIPKMMLGQREIAEARFRFDLDGKE